MRLRVRHECLHLRGLPGAAITLKDGIVEQSNFGDFAVPRITDMPQFAVHIVPSADLLRARRLGGRQARARRAGRAQATAEVFRKAGLTHFRRAAETPFNLIYEVRR